MSSAPDLKTLLERLGNVKARNTEIRAMAQEQGKNHALATELWRHGGVAARMLSLLIVDLKAVDAGALETLVSDLDEVDGKDQSQLLDWLIANVIMKKAALKKEAGNWRSDGAAIKRRIYWSVQARSVRAENAEQNEELLAHIEKELGAVEGPIQWNMNWCAAQIGIADERLRDRCLALGERLGLYKDYVVSKGCTSPYLPIWIRSVVEKKGGA